MESVLYGEQPVVPDLARLDGPRSRAIPRAIPVPYWPLKRTVGVLTSGTGGMAEKPCCAWIVGPRARPDTFQDSLSGPPPAAPSSAEGMHRPEMSLDHQVGMSPDHHQETRCHPR